MADPSPADVADAEKSSTADEGKNPDGNGAAAEEKKQPRTYTEAYVKQLRGEAADGRNRIAELEEKLQEHEDAGKSQVEKLTGERDTLKDERDQLAAFKLRVEVAAERGLDLSAVKFLTGSTREEVELHAEELGQLLQAKATKPAAGFDGGARTTAPEKLSPEQEHNSLLLQAMGRSERRAT